jgi:hypothetical protein
VPFAIALAVMIFFLAFPLAFARVVPTASRKPIVTNRAELNLDIYTPLS